MKKKLIYFLIAITLIAIIFIAFDTSLKTKIYKVESTKIKNPIKVVLLTDLHSCKYGQNQKELIDAVEINNPDIILLGGDILDDKIVDNNTKLVLEAISKEYPCYYVTGNHEYWSKRVNEMVELVKSYGVTVLRGENKEISINGQKINIAGIDDDEEFDDENTGLYKQLENTKNKNNEYFSILLAHRPIHIKTYLNYNFDLVVSGHAHGGQWRIPGILNGLYAPDEGLFPKHAGGRYLFGNGQMIVSRGLARESTRVPRIFNPPELVVIELY